LQPYSHTNDAASALTGLVCCGSLVVLPVLWIGVSIAILFWLAKDAKARGMDGAVWLILIFFTGPIGLAIYLFSRPQGLLIRCHNCGNNRMEVSVKCPHCGAGRGNGRRQYDDDDGEEDEEPPPPRPVPRSVVSCPGCGTRLSAPKQGLSRGQKFACPKCKTRIQLDEDWQ
jgi:ribosomal protein L37E